MNPNGLLLAYDGIDKANLLRFVDSPFYGGIKYTMLEKIINPAIALRDGHPLISNPLRALLDSHYIHEVVVACHDSSKSRLEEMTSSLNNQRKKLNVVSVNGNIGDIVQQAIGNFSSSKPVFLMLPDLPLVRGEDVDFAIDDLSCRIDSSADAYIPVMPTDYFQPVFFRAKQKRVGISIREKRNELRKYCFLNFIIFDPEAHNPTFTTQFYHSRLFRTASGVRDIIKQIPLEYVRELAIKRFRQDLTFEDLENVGRLLSKRAIKVVPCHNPRYLAFAFDIDTKNDYVGYLNS